MVLNPLEIETNVHLRVNRPQKITFADVRDMSVRGLLIYCSDYKCSHLITMSGDRWPDNMRCRISIRGSSARPAASAVPM
jgi:hypothetical protein